MAHVLLRNDAMQPLPPTLHLTATDDRARANETMPTNLAGSPLASASAAANDASLALRLAQRAFAPLLERSARHTTFRFAQLRSGARRVLSALSADDRVRLARWLALLCANAGDRACEVVESRLGRVDALLATAVVALLATLPEADAARGAVSA